jgi:hypothetical protein
MPNFATTYLGNSPNGERAYTGMIRELRIWNQIRTERELFLNRFIEINNRTNLMYYYKMVGGETDNLRI